MAEPRPFLQFKANLADALLNGGGACSAGADPGSTVELPAGRLSLRVTGAVEHATPMLAWLNQARVEGRLIVNTETGTVCLQLYLGE